MLRRERLAAGYSLLRLARATGCARSTIRRLQAGQLRPRESLLRCIAGVLAVDDPAPLAARLIKAAGSSCQPDTPASQRARSRRATTAALAGHRPLPIDLARALTLHRQADAAWSRALALLARPGALGNVTVLDEVLRLQDRARLLREQAGPPVILIIGNHQIKAGWSM
ncbi:helix-turn-helix domain-containing protein [Crossiella sp. CA198]|uniref:helix-turn-helix domain-containing protein n=1 Tax=Crossiella sp. CA198 TaxID=3455607 RepID=UPI003F8CFE4D